MNTPMLDKDLVSWAVKQSKDVVISLPTRADNEPDANEGQLAEIERLVGKEQAASAKALGTWQAQALIQRLREERRDFTNQVLGEAAAKQNERNAANGLLFILGLALAAWLISTLF